MWFYPRIILDLALLIYINSRLVIELNSEPFLSVEISFDAWIKFNIFEMMNKAVHKAVKSFILKMINKCNYSDYALMVVTIATETWKNHLNFPVIGNKYIV